MTRIAVEVNECPPCLNRFRLAVFTATPGRRFLSSGGKTEHRQRQWTCFNDDGDF